MISYRWPGFVCFFSAAVGFTAGCSKDSAGESTVSTTPTATSSDHSVTPDDSHMMPARPLNPGDWPQWRGPWGDNVAHQASQWTYDWPAEGPKQLWKAEIGIGFSSFAVANGKVFTMGHEADPPEQGDKLANDVVWRLDANNGHVDWSFKYPAKIVANLHEGGPAATPTVDANRVYTVSKDGQVYCLDATSGAKIWKAELTPLTGVDMPGWGFSSSVRISGNLAILDAGRTVAFDKETGELIWKTDKYKPGYGTPTLFNALNQSLVAVLNNDFLLVLRTKDGSEVAKNQMEHKLRYQCRHADRVSQGRRRDNFHLHRLRQRLRAFSASRGQERAGESVRRKEACDPHAWPPRRCQRWRRLRFRWAKLCWIAVQCDGDRLHVWQNALEEARLRLRYVDDRRQPLDHPWRREGKLGIAECHAK